MSRPLIRKYRPTIWEEMVGHEAQIGALRRAIASDTCPHAFLFTGPAGTGKTTLARIVALEVNAEALEIDAASNSGVDDMRELVVLGSHMSLSGAGKRMIIIDECHTLSKPAFQAILKILEEPPEHLYLALCTTERNKVPETIVTRCYHVGLRPLPPQDIEDLVLAVCSIENWNISGDVLQAVVQAATGQPRKALTILQSVHDAPTRDEVKRIISLLDETDSIKDLCQLLASGKMSWELLKVPLAKIADDEFDNAAIMMARYIMGAMMNAKDHDAKRLWHLLDALVWPSETYDRKAAFVAAIGRMLWAGV